jgi:hypothetical protein
MATVTQTFTSDATILEVRSKAPNYHKKASELIHQGRSLLALMRKWGTIKHEDISWSDVWNAVTQLPQVREWADDVLPMFQPGPNPIQFNLGDGSYEADDKFTRMQYLRTNGNRNQIQNYYKDKSKYLAQSMGNKFNFEFLHGSGTGRRITGLDTVLSAASGTNIAADVVACPGAAITYAAQTLRPGARAGSWPATLSVKPNANLATDWPIIGNQTSYDPTMTEYDATAPLKLNSTSTSWQAGATWALACEEQLRYFLSVQGQRGGRVADATSPINILCGEQRLRQAKTHFSAKNYALVPVPEARDWGMPETVRFEGALLNTDSDVGSDVAYCIQPDMISYHTPQPDLWEVHGPEWKMEYTAYLYLLLAIGKLKIQPKFQGDIRDVA